MNECSFKFNNRPKPVKLFSFFHSINGRSWFAHSLVFHTYPGNAKPPSPRLPNMKFFSASEKHAATNTPVFVLRNDCGCIPASRIASYATSIAMRPCGSIKLTCFECIPKNDASNLPKLFITPLREKKEDEFLKQFTLHFILSRSIHLFYLGILDSCYFSIVHLYRLSYLSINCIVRSKVKLKISF